MLSSVPGVVWFILGVAIVVAVLVTYGPWLAEQWAKNRAISNCEAIRAELEEQRTLGGATSRIAQLQAELTACTQEAQTYGAEASVAEVTVAGCKAMVGAMDSNHSSFRATDRSDIVKRQNLRSNVLGIGERLVDCLQQALAEAVSESSLFAPATVLAIYKDIRAQAVRGLAASEMRIRCYESDPACGRYDGSLETDNGTKIASEQQAITLPLRAVLADVDQRIADLTAQQNAAAGTNLAALAGSSLLSSGFSFGGSFQGGIA